MKPQRLSLPYRFGFYNSLDKRLIGAMRPKEGNEEAQRSILISKWLSEAILKPK